MIHLPSFRAGLEAAAELLRTTKGIETHYGPHLASQVLKLKPPRKSTKATKARSSHRKEKAATKAEKREADAEVRALVMKRADGFCESCGNYFSTFNPAEWDHFLGRGRVAASVANTWALCRDCHRAKTNNEPSARWWLERWIRHCARFAEHADLLVWRGLHHAEAERARSRLSGIVAIREARP